MIKITSKEEKEKTFQNTLSRLNVLPNMNYELLRKISLVLNFAMNGEDTYLLVDDNDSYNLVIRTADNHQISKKITIDGFIGNDILLKLSIKGKQLKVEFNIFGKDDNFCRVAKSIIEIKRTYNIEGDRIITSIENYGAEYKKEGNNYKGNIIHVRKLKHFAVDGTIVEEKITKENIQDTTDLVSIKLMAEKDQIPTFNNGEYVVTERLVNNQALRYTFDKSNKKIDWVELEPESKDKFKDIGMTCRLDEESARYLIKKYSYYKRP